MEIRRWDWSDWLAKFNEVTSADPFIRENPDTHERERMRGGGEERERGEAAPARAPKCLPDMGKI